MILKRNMPIIRIISLQGSKRRNSASWSNSDLPFTFFDASSGISPGLTFHVDVAKLLYGRELTRGEIGCSISHRRVIKSLVNDIKGWACIFEDDALFSSITVLDFLRTLDSENHIEPIVLILGHSKTVASNAWLQNLKQPRYESKYFGTTKFSKRFNANFCGTVAYCINEPAAQIICRMPDPFYLADDWDIFSNAGINIFHADKPLVYEDLTEISTTGNTIKVLHTLNWNTAFSELTTALINQLRFHFFRRLSLNRVKK